MQLNLGYSSLYAYFRFDCIDPLVPVSRVSCPEIGSQNYLQVHNEKRKRYSRFLNSGVGGNGIEPLTPILLLIGRIL